MNVLILGATGYAGFHAAIALRDRGHTVTALARDTTTKRAAELRQNEVRVVEGDLQQPATYRELLQMSDATVYTVSDSADAEGTDRKMFATMRTVSAADPLRKRLFVYTTGCSIYGPRPERVMDETTPGNTAHVLHYRMQLEQELFGFEGFRKIVVRPGFMYGKDGSSSMAARWFEMGERGTAEFTGNREKGWSWIHVSDLAAAYVRAVESNLAIDNEIFCLADEQRPKCLEVMRECLRVAGYTGEIKFSPVDPDEFTSIAFDQNEFITSQKAHRLLGWRAKHTGVLDELETFYSAWKTAHNNLK